MPEENKLTTSNKGYELTQQAQNDVKEIWVYFADFNESAANKLIKEIFDKFQFLSENTKLGKKRDEIFLNLRSFPHKKYIIFYLEIEAKRIEIYRVLHASRDIEGLFEEFFEGLKE